MKTLEKAHDLKIIIGDFHQETNSFNGSTWTFDNFKADTFLEKDQVLSAYGTNTGKSLCGIIEVLQDAGVSIIPTCALRSTSGGPVEQEVVDYFVNSVLTAYSEHPNVDALVLSLHGATQGTQTDDVCGYVLRKLRSAVGSDVVISVACDLHGNMTQDCFDNADFICGFHTYPHIDQKETGRRAATLALRKLCDNTQFYMGYVSVPMILPASGYTSESGPFKEIVDYCRKLVENGELTDYSVFQMQPWLDVNPGGSSVITIGESEDKVKEYNKIIAKLLFRSRKICWPKLMTCEEVIKKAEKAVNGKPVVLVDFADSLGAGASGTSAAVLWAILNSKSEVKAVMNVGDVAAVHKAQKVGKGNSAIFTLGRNLEGRKDMSVTAEALVMDICSGVFYQAGPVAAGQRRDMGTTALLKVGNCTVVVCEHPCGTGDLEAYRSFGVDPLDYQLVSVKANTSFRAGYEPIAQEICMTDTPGASTSNLLSLPFTHIRRPFYPFDSMDDYVIADCSVKKI